MTARPHFTEHESQAAQRLEHLSDIGALPADEADDIRTLLAALVRVDREARGQ
ncbi:MAG: hypothetical protein ACRDQA_18320 [Nocardioidaceae bacterium]